MTRLTSILLFVGVCFANIHLPAFGQANILSDTSNASYALSLFFKANAQQSRLNNGREYIPHEAYISGHPFFLNQEWTPGNIVYDGSSFQDVKMLYDLEKDEVIILNFLLPNKLSLVRQKIEEFEIHGHHFIYLKTDNLNAESSGGFYDRLYQQKISVFAKRVKKIRVTNNTTLSASFEPEDEYFLMKEGVLYPVKSQKSVLNVLKDKKPEIVQYLRKNNVVFRLDPQKAIILMASYYDTLSD